MTFGENHYRHPYPYFYQYQKLMAGRNRKMIGWREVVEGNIYQTVQHAASRDIKALRGLSSAASAANAVVEQRCVH